MRTVERKIVTLAELRDIGGKPYQRAEYYRTLLRHLAAAHSPLAAAQHYQTHRYFMG
jgi:hypothetical protein